ncbi:MAG TPA: MarR family transcriptional regulator [Alphaproteobacteria bacterium]|jgi:DNA-binding MarR family transcriptional regulator|nr:MarR family transcriptional regulator [Alphaproteobacteria bacterium]
MSNEPLATDPTLPEPAELTAIFDRAEMRDLYRISYLANALVLPVYDGIKRDFGLTRGEYLLIFCLAHLPVLTAQDVARMTKRPRNTISRAVHRMLAEGFIDRALDPEDGRQARLTITEKGRALHRAVVRRWLAREAEALAVLDDAERAALDRILQKLVMHAADLPE